MEQPDIKYVKFEDKELTTFCELLDIENEKMVNLGDIEATCK